MKYETEIYTLATGAIGLCLIALMLMVLTPNDCRKGDVVDLLNCGGE